MRKEDRTDVQTVRLAILGAPGVGKSALSVRFLTKRFIGEYKSGTDILYKFTTCLGRSSISVELKDVSPSRSTSSCDVIKLHLQWADAFVLVYSITEQSSFRWVVESLEFLQRHQYSIPTIILENKADLAHIREVKELEGRNLCVYQGYNFFESSAADAFDSITEIMEEFIRTIRKEKNSVGGSSSSPKLKKMSVSKLLGSLIGKTPKNNITEFVILDRKDFSKLTPAIRYL